MTWLLSLLVRSGVRKNKSKFCCSVHKFHLIPKTLFGFGFGFGIELVLVSDCLKEMCT